MPVNEHLINYGVVESLECTEQIKSLGARRVDDAMESLKWALARKPEKFPAEGKFRFWKTEALGGVPELLVVFLIRPDQEQVEILSVEADSAAAWEALDPFAFQ